MFSLHTGIARVHSDLHRQCRHKRVLLFIRFSCLALNPIFMLPEFETDPPTRVQRISFAKVVVYGHIKPKIYDNRRGI